MLLTIPAAAAQLAVSPRTVRRLVERGELVAVRIGRAVRIRRSDLDSWVATPATQTQPCPTDAKTRPSGGPPTPTREAAALDALLEPPTARKPQPSRANGGPSRTNRGNGAPTSVTALRP